MIKKKTIKKNLRKMSKKTWVGGQKVWKHAQMGQFEHILENPGSRCEGEIWIGRQVP